MADNDDKSPRFSEQRQAAADEISDWLVGRGAMVMLGIAVALVVVFIAIQAGF